MLNPVHPPATGSPSASTAELTATVVVCTSSHERRSLLEACVASVLAGERKPDELIAVVDTDPTLAAELRESLPSDVQIVVSERAGLSEARNAGIDAASSDVVAFVDDDATVAFRWLASLMKLFADDRVLGAGGPIVPRWGADRRWLCDELLWVVGCTYDGHREDAGPIRNPIGCNMAFRRRELLEVGSFATAFGKRGDALATCDETELALRVERAFGPGRICFGPAASVEHFVPPDRVSWRLLVRRSISEGLAKGRLRQLYKRAAVGPEREYARRLVLHNVPRLVREAVRRRHTDHALSALAILSSLMIASMAFLVGSVGEQWRRLLEHLRIPLHRDGYALALNSGFTAATGLLYWIIAAKTYSARSVGLNSALISSMMFLAGVASLNLPNIIVRFLPESGSETRRRVTWAYGVSISLAVCAGVVFTLGIGMWSPRLSFLRSNHSLAAWFLFSTLAWCLFSIQDSVLTAIGRAIWVPIENAIFSLVKIALLVAVAAAMPVYGIFVSWTIAMLLSVVGVNLIVFARLLRGASQQARKPVASIRNRAFARYFAADYTCSVAWLSTTNLMPVVVTAAAGATTNAYYSLAYAVALPFYLFGANIGTSLTLHGTTNPSALAALTRKAAIQGARVLVPSVALILLLTPYLLSLFGPRYAANSAMVLRLLAAGALPNFVMALAIAVARVQRRLRRVVIAVVTEAVLALSIATPLVHALGAEGAALAFVCAQCVVAVGLLLTWRGSLPERVAGELRATSSEVASEPGRVG